MKGDSRSEPRRRTLVISGVSMTEGGILSVLRSVVAAAEDELGTEWRIVVLVHRRDLIQPRLAELLEFPGIKRSWLGRLWFEWMTSRRIARELRANVWIALHDITPLVDVERQFVYCHNPACFGRVTPRAAYFDWIFVAHSLLYGVIYSLNIRRNRQVFVQQSWIRDAFLMRFGARKVLVSRPAPVLSAAAPRDAASPSGICSHWFYPTFPRHFKNVELIGNALVRLEQDSSWQGSVSVTIDGTENRYARWLYRRFGHLRSLKFIGRKSAAEVQQLYSNCDGLLFPSKLETWGLPISEAQSHGKPVLVADLPYARETVGAYDKVAFFDPDDAGALSSLLLDLHRGGSRLGSSSAPSIAPQHVLTGWSALVRECCC